MISVKKTGEISTQKLITSFLRRVRKYGTIVRSRKTQYYIKPISELQQHRKAVRKAKWLEAQSNRTKMAKKI
jgi:DNA-binding GntR family transcriptional regulator